MHFNDSKNSLIIESATLKNRIEQIPNQCGCYLMKDDEDRLLYVGKSKNLKTRVKSYFRNISQHSPRIRLMVRQVSDIEIIVTDNEAEALALESNLIKNNQPYFNILLKDDKKYPFLCISWSDTYPRIFITRRRRERKPLDKFYGPYVDVGLLRSTLSIIKKVFPLRQRPRPLYKDRTCLNYSIGRCPGVCQQVISSEEYRQTIKKVAMIFQGRSDELKVLLNAQMIKYSNLEDYERAAKIRDQIRGLEQLTATQKMSIPDSSVSRDIIAMASDERVASVQLFQMRSGKLVGRIGYITEASKMNNNIILQKIIEEHYSQLDSVELPSELVLQYNLPKTNLISEWLSELRGSRVNINYPKRRNKAELIDLVEKNALYELQRLKSTQEKQLLALEDLAQLLELNCAPRRIEGYDISHIQGSDPVGSQVVFIDGIPAKQHYRKYKINSRSISIGHSDDYMALTELIRRRFRKWSKIKNEFGNIEQFKKRASSALHISDVNDWPDLIMIDGGKGQLAAVNEALRELGLDGEVVTCSLAKKNEEIYVPDSTSPLISEKDQIGVRLLRRLRDEAHRFALSFHRQKRGQRMTRTRLGEIPGLGPKRIKALLSYFHSIEAIQLATVEKISLTPGFGKKNAQEVWNYFHPEQEI